MNIEELLNEIDVQFTKKSLGIPMDQVPMITKIIVPKEVWNSFIDGEYLDPAEKTIEEEESIYVLGDEDMFKRCIDHTPINIEIEKRIKREVWETQKHIIIPTPNLGGIPLEQGEVTKVVVIVEGKPPIKRVFKKKQYESLTENTF